MVFILKLIKFMALLFVACAVVYFILFNGSTVELSFGHFGSIAMPAAVIYIIFFFLGALTVSTYFGYEFTRRSLKLGKIERKLRKIEGSGSEGRSQETSVTGSQTYL